MKNIPHNSPTLGGEEGEAVKKILESNWLIAGPEVKKFEDSVKKYIGVTHAVATNSGHSALHLALLALGVKKGDEVITSSYTVSDILNAIFYVGATPILIDTERDGFNLDSDFIKKKITTKTKAIIVPHMFGFPAQVKKIKTYEVPVIEDCAQSLGTTLDGNHFGSYGDISIFSFYATKIMTTGQGGMVVTNNKKYMDVMRDITSYNAPSTYKVRYNYPMTDIAAAMGNIQFKKLEGFLEKRKQIAKQYQKVLGKKGVRHYPRKSDSHINHFRFILQFENKKNRDKAQLFLTKNGITAIHPLKNHEVLHRLLQQDAKDFPNTEKLTHTTLSLPLYPTLQAVEIKRIVSVLEKL